ncbi:hypothetical protein J3R30DRAFT_3706809 [Lentinula aciculospora]|uniref:DEK C-terminal domain-containing protein n=1 Tax=Lentinula aciculospora TaxID=153920 RepID=A0A9W9A5J5_9AGAR|nr:hypothetical protein J3R30DRAFT_3706809 [Lentinula aciculospora]
MLHPNPNVVSDMTRKIVFDAGKDGTLSNLTPNVIRERLENDLALENGSLKPLKYVIRKAIEKALKETEEDEEEEDLDDNGEVSEEQEQEVATKIKTKKEKQKKTTEKPSTKKPSKSTPKLEQPSSEAPTKSKKRKSELEDESGSSKTKKSRLSNASNDAKSKKKKETKAFPSAAVVPPSSDFEDDVPAKLTQDDLFSANETTPQKPASKQEPIEKHVSIANEISDTESPPPQLGEPEKSESELSVLIDEPPKRKKKGKAKEVSKKPVSLSSILDQSIEEQSSETSEVKEKKKRKGAAITTLSKDEETIKRLKSLINACGVRKVWSKLFKDIDDSHSKQIALLRKMLADLGMTGRLSMEQAKVIKEKRELASELADVQSFEQSVKKQSSRDSRSAATKEKSVEVESDKGSDEEGDIRPAKRKTNARQSIMAFLGDQSDSE